MVEYEHGYCNLKGRRNRLKRKHFGITTVYTLVVCTMLLIINVVLGAAMARQSGDAMKNLIRRHMISVADTASAMIDGDELAALTEDDVDSESFRHIAGILTRIKDAQKDADIKYIYLVRRVEDHYEYTVDPDPVEPADFGEEVVDTPAQDTAWAGTSAIDPEAVEDEWGCYYTSWSPVRDSSGMVIGMVGVDFAADWFDQQMSRHTVTVVLISGLSLLVSLAIMSLLTWQHYRRFRLLEEDLSTLSGNVESLARDVTGRMEELEEEELNAGDQDSDIIRALSEKTRSTQRRLAEYKKFVQAQAFTDDMTGVGNRDAYIDCIKGLNEAIDKGTAAFAVAVFDVNGLKSTNDNYGHECGDRIIMDTAMLIGRVFGRERLFRIGGDEFLAVCMDMGEEEMRADIERLEAEIERFNREEKRYAMPFSFSCGGTVYRPGEDASFKEVFKRADQAMYKDKGAFYRRHGDRSEHYDLGASPDFS